MRKLLILIIGLALFSSNITYGYGTRTTPLGGLYTRDIDGTSLRGIGVELFRGYRFGTQAVYNDSGSTTATDGRLDVREYQYGKTLAIKVDSVATGGTYTVVVNEFIGTESSSVVFNTYNYTATGTTRIPLTDYCEYINLKCYASTSTASTMATITGDFVELKNR